MMAAVHGTRTLPHAKTTACNLCPCVSCKRLDGDKRVAWAVTGARASRRAVSTFSFVFYCKNKFV